MSQFVISLLLDVELRWEDSNQRHSAGELKNLVSHHWCLGGFTSSFDLISWIPVPLELAGAREPLAHRIPGV
jgi:hypothetical protein